MRPACGEETDEQDMPEYSGHIELFIIPFRRHGCILPLLVLNRCAEASQAYTGKGIF